jgi:2-amino-4-hydroxy-6-hydroxymethyldihydropteridine diphosphokinase
MNRNIAYIALGTNIGDREQNLKEAIQFLNDDSKISTLAVSSIYETKPIGFTEQEDFLNMVIKINTQYNPRGLIERTMKIEERLGRVRDVHWGPRIIDLDILLFNQDNIESEQLIVPHPRMTERAFVMIPLIEIAGDINIPNVTSSVQQLVDLLNDKEGVRLWKRINGEEELELIGS